MKLNSDYSSGNGALFLKVADALRDDFRFAHVAEAGLLTATGHEEKIILHRPKAMKNKFEENEVVYTGDKYTGEFTMS